MKTVGPQCGHRVMGPSSGFQAQHFMSSNFGSDWSDQVGIETYDGWIFGPVNIISYSMLICFCFSKTPRSYMWRQKNKLCTSKLFLGTLNTVGWA